VGYCAGDIGTFNGVVVEPEGDFKILWVHCCTDVFDEEVATTINFNVERGGGVWGGGTLRGWGLGPI